MIIARWSDGKNELFKGLNDVYKGPSKFLSGMVSKLQRIKCVKVV